MPNDRKHGKTPPKRWRLSWIGRWRPGRPEPVVIDIRDHLRRREDPQPDPVPPSAALRRAS